MEEDKFIEFQLALWKHTVEIARVKMGEDFSIEAVQAIYAEVNKDRRAEKIERYRAERAKEQLEQGFRRCKVCGRVLTNKEIDFIDKHQGEEICYHCAQKRKQTQSG